MRNSSQRCTCTDSGKQLELGTQMPVETHDMALHHAQHACALLTLHLKEKDMVVLALCYIVQPCLHVPSTAWDILYQCWASMTLVLNASMLGLINALLMIVQILQIQYLTACSFFDRFVVFWVIWSVSPLALSIYLSVCASYLCVCVHHTNVGLFFFQ